MEIVIIESHTWEMMMARFETFAERVEQLCRCNGDKAMQKWLDNQEVCGILNISKRTLQTYRDNGTLPFCPDRAQDVLPSAGCRASNQQNKSRNIMSEFIDSKNERVTRFCQLLDRMTNGIQHLVANHKPTLNGEHYLTDSEVFAKLKVSRRTLQEWRNNGQIAYIQLGGKILYAESAIQAMLEKFYVKAWE